MDNGKVKSVFDVRSVSKGLCVCNSQLDRVSSWQGSVYRVYAQLSSQSIEGSEGGSVWILQDIVHKKRVLERTSFNRNRCGNRKQWGDLKLLASKVVSLAIKASATFWDLVRCADTDDSEVESYFDEWGLAVRIRVFDLPLYTVDSC